LASNSNTFDAVADELLIKLEREGRHKTTLTKLRWLLSLARPDLGARPIADISAAEILVPLREVEARGNYETARRLRVTIGQVFRYAIATARAENEPTFCRWEQTGHLAFRPRCRRARCSLAGTG
jgi:integrase